MKNTTLIGFLILINVNINAQITNSNDTKGVFSLDIAQDWFVDWWHNKNFDRNYTQGTGFSYTKKDLHKSLLFLPLNLFINLNDSIHKDKKSIGGVAPFKELPSRMTMGVTAFTPRIIDSESPIIGDRPFANVIFLSTTRYRMDIEMTLSTKTSFSYGLFGTNIANTFQSFAHKNIVKGRPTEISWHHQIFRGGKFAFLFSQQTTKVLKITTPKIDTQKVNTSEKIDLKNKLDSIPFWRTSINLGYNLDIGWYSTIGSTLTIKFGKFSKNYNTLDLSSPMSVANYKEMGKKKGWRKQRECFIFSSFSPRVTPYNALLLGQPFVKSRYTLKYEDYNPFILDIKYGIVLTSLKLDTKPGKTPFSRTDFVLSLNHRSPEIRNKEFKRWHHWGEVSINLPFL